MRTTKPIDATVDELENAKETALSLLKENVSQTAMDLFYTESLEELETGIRQLNDFSSKSWLLSALLLYTLIYNKEIYSQSGLPWAEYAKQSRERLGIDQRDITEQLSAARFFIQNHKSLERKGFDPRGSNLKLARAELALELTHDKDAVMEHLVNDTTRDFKVWYQGYKQTKAVPAQSEYKRSDIGYKDNKFTIGGREAVKVSDEIPEADREKLEGFMKTIFEAMARGYKPTG